MDKKQRAKRNAAIYSACLSQLTSFAEVAKSRRMTGARIEQIFREEAKRRHPEIFDSIVPGRGFRFRFLVALGAQTQAGAA